MRPHIRRFELLLLAVIVLWMVAIYFQARSRSEGSRASLLGSDGFDIELTDTQVTSMLSFLGPESDEKFTLLFVTKGAEFDKSLIEFLAYVADSLPKQVSVHVISPIKLTQRGLTQSMLRNHVDFGMVWVQSLGVMGGGWENCLIALNPKRVPTFVKINATKRKTALLITNQIIPDAMKYCVTGILSTRELEIYSFSDSSQVVLSNHTHLVIYPSICSECGEDALLKSIERRIREEIELQSTDVRANIPLVVFPRSADHYALQDYLGTEFPLLSKSPRTFAFFDVPPMNCIRLHSLREYPLLLSVIDSNTARAIGPRELLGAIYGDPQ